jgi:hypothetical protein
MKIVEILSATSDREIPSNDTEPVPTHIADQDLMAHIANAFTSDGAVKLLWDLRMADEAPRPKTSREDIGIHQGPGGTRLNSLASSSGATRGKTFTPPF